VVLQLHEQVVLAEDVLEPSRLLEGLALVALQQRLQHVPAEATGGGHQPLVVARQQVPVHARLVVVALEEGEAGQLDEVLVADVVLGQQGEVVVELLAALGVTAGVVLPTTSSRALGP
jgi:predicted ABC-type transport system involved in lysophospholipase L1 biosynthesis ATPase subunit